MLGSLLRYDFRALNKTMIPLQLGVLLAGILGTVCANISYRSIMTDSSYGYYSSSYTTMSMAESLLQSFMLLAAILLFSLVFVSSFVVLILIARHIYKNFYSSEGYLTFTLPVSVDSHLLSKAISGVVWMLINALVIGLSITLLVFFGFADQGVVNFEALKSLGAAFSEFVSPLGLILLVELIIVGFVSVVMSVYQVMFSIVLGGAAARTHKVLAAIGIYIATNMIMGIINSMLYFFVAMGMYMVDGGSSSYSSLSWFAEMQPTLLVSGVVSVVLVVVFHLVSRVSLKKSLNLE